MKARTRSLRFVPVLIVAAALSLSVRVGDLWRDVDAAFGPSAGVALAAESGGPLGPDPAAVPAAESKPAPAPALEAPQPTARQDPPDPQDSQDPQYSQTAAGRFEPWTIAPSGEARQPKSGSAEGGDGRDEARTAAAQPSEVPDPTTRPDRLVASLPDPYDFTDEEISLLQQLSVRREQIEQRRSVVEQREALLAAAEARVERKVTELEDLRRIIEELVIQHDEQEEAQLRSLVKIYENMKPKEAARIFEQLDMVVLLEVIDRMKERKVAPVLARMSPDRAQQITLELAQRRDLPVAKE